MRLTLRTLLAYLDDILEPAQAREIGRKVQSAPLAKELVSRIRDVVRRRRLGAPALDGPESGLDPNVVAEYLDNQLTPAQVAQTERVLLNSEMHLAETASAHQILTLVLGEPVEVLPESRKRMYALGPVQAGEKLIVESDEPTQAVVEPTDRLAVKEPRESAGSNGAAHADTGVELAEYVREQQRSRRWWPLVGIALLIGVFVALQWSGRLTNSGSQEVADNRTNSSTNVSNLQPNDPQTSVSEPSVVDSGEPTMAAAEPDPDASTTANVNPTDGPEVIAATTPTPSDSNATTEPSAIDAPAPADVPEAVDVTPPADAMDTADVAVAGVEPTDTPNVTILAPPGDDDANEDAAMPAPPPAPVVADEVPAAPKPAPVVLAYDKGNSILLQETIEEGWKLVPDGSELGENIRLAVPRPYVAHFQVGNLPVDVHLAAGSRMSTYAAPDAAMGIRVERGRIVISRRVEDEADGEPISIRIAVNNERWTATLPASAARFAIDATPVPPIRLDKAYEGFPFKVWAVGNEGVVILASSKGEERNIGPEDRVALAGPKSGEVLVEPGQGNNWLVGKDPVGQWVAGPTAPTDIRDATRFAKEFDPEVSVSDTMPALLKHERSWMARRAVQCLALTQDYRALVHALAVAEHDEATAEAILGLREWLPSDAEFGEFLKAALAQEFVEDESQSIYQLLWGYDEQHARNLKVSRELVRWLGSDQPAIRRMAYLHVLRLTGQQDEYRPSLTSDRMVSFRKRWERQIDRHGTLLKD